MMSNPNYPLKNIPGPHPHDVLCGRGGGTNAHIGNSHWRMLVSANKELYVTLPKRQKMLLSKSIVNAVRSQNPPGRFLLKDAKTDLWYDVGDQRAQEKTSQALREGAPEIRSKLSDGPDDVASSNASATSADNNEVARTPPPGRSTSFNSQKSNTSASVTPPRRQMESPVKQQAPSAYAGDPISLRAATSGGSSKSMPPPPVVIAPVPVVALPQPIEPQGPVPDRKRNVSSKKIQTSATSGSSANQYNNNNNNNNFQQQHQQPQRREDEHAAIHASSSSAAVNNNHHNNHHRFPSIDDDEVVEPPTGLDQDQGFSFGSIAMTDMEQAKLMNGCSFGTVMSYAYQNNNQHQHSADDDNDQPIPISTQQKQSTSMPPPLPPHHVDTTPRMDNHNQIPRGVHFAAGRGPNPQHQQHPPPLPVDGGLEPAGLSFGSVMSVGTADIKLEGAGLSFGSMMSYTKDERGGGGGHGGGYGYGAGGSIPLAPVDGGLEAIGTSFGSLSLATHDRHNLEESLQAEIDAVTAQVAAEAAAEAAAGNAEAVPTYLQQQKSKGSLLECSDTDSEEEQVKSEQIIYQQSLEWEKLKATLAQQNNNNNPHNSMPGRVGHPPDFGPPQHQHQQQHQKQPDQYQYYHHQQYNHQQQYAYQGGGGGAPPMGALDIPATSFDRDFSQMSAISVGDDLLGFGEQIMPTDLNMNAHQQHHHDDSGHDSGDAFFMPPPPPPVRKQESDNWETPQQIEYAYNNGQQQQQQQQQQQAGEYGSYR